MKELAQFDNDKKGEVDTSVQTCDYEAMDIVQTTEYSDHSYANYPSEDLIPDTWTLQTQNWC